MSFIEMNARRPGKPAAAPVMCSVTKEHLVVIVRCQLAIEMGWKIGQKLRVLRGEGDDAGLLRLTPGPMGYALSQTSPIHCALRMKIPAWPGLPDVHPPVNAEFARAGKGKDGVLDIILPEEFR